MKIIIRYFILIYIYILPINAATVNSKPTMTTVLSSDYNIFYEDNSSRFNITLGDLNQEDLTVSMIFTYNSSSYDLSSSTSYLKFDSSDFILEQPITFQQYDASTLFFTLTNKTTSPEFSSQGELNITVSDGIDSVSEFFPILFEPINDAPSLTNSDITLEENFGEYTITLTSFDEEGNIVHYRLDSYDTSLVKIVLNSDNTLTLTSLPNKYGVTTVNISLDDGTDQATGSFELNITELPNHAPLLSIDDVDLSNDFNEYNITLNATDSENDILTYKLGDYNSSLVNIILNDNKLFFESIYNQYGQTLVDINVSDGENPDVNTSFMLTINPVFELNIQTIEDISQNEDGAGVIIDLNATGDVGLQIDLIDYSIKSLSNTNIADVFIENNERLIIKPKPNQYGSVDIIVEANQSNYRDQEIFTYTLNPIDDIPYIYPIKDISLTTQHIIKSYEINISLFDDNINTIKYIASNSDILSNINIEDLNNTYAKFIFTPAKEVTGDSTITLTAIDDSEQTYSERFTISIKDDYEISCLNNLYSALTFDNFKGQNSSQNFIIHNLDPIYYLNDVCDAQISWKSSNSTILSDNGVITPPLNDTNVVFNATIKTGDKNQTKPFILTIKSSNNPDYLDLLTFDTIKGKNIHKNNILFTLNLPNQIQNKNITWSSSDENIISPYNGYITYPNTTQSKTIKLTATMDNRSKIFELIVPNYINDDKEILNRDKYWLSYDLLLDKNSNTQRVISDLYLPTTAPYGSTIVWSSSNSDIILNNGDVVRDATQDTTVLLTATLTLNDSSITKTFLFNVLKQDTNIINTNTLEIIRDNYDIKILHSIYTNTSLSFEYSADIEQIEKDDSIVTRIEEEDFIGQSTITSDGLFFAKTEYLNKIPYQYSALSVYIPNTQNKINTDGSISSTLKENNKSYQIVLNKDGTSSQEIDINNITTKVESNIMNTQVLLSENNESITTIDEINTTTINRIEVIVLEDGSIQAHIKEINSSNSQTINTKQFFDTQTAPIGSDVIIDTFNNVNYIKITMPLNTTKVIK